MRDCTGCKNHNKSDKHTCAHSLHMYYLNPKNRSQASSDLIKAVLGRENHNDAYFKICNLRLKDNF